MRILSALAFLFSMQFSFAAFAQYYSLETDSTELDYVYGNLYAYVNGRHDSSYDSSLVNHVNAMGCLPRGALLKELRPEGMKALVYRHYSGILRKGQSIVIEMNLCDDAIVSSLPSLSLRVTTRDLSNYGIQSNFSKNTDASVAFYAPNGSVIAMNGPIYNNQNYKKAYRRLMTDLPQSGVYRLVITSSGKADIGIGEINILLGSAGE